MHVPRLPSAKVTVQRICGAARAATQRRAITDIRSVMCFDVSPAALRSSNRSRAKVVRAVVTACPLFVSRSVGPCSCVRASIPWHAPIFHLLTCNASLAASGFCKYLFEGGSIERYRNRNTVEATLFHDQHALVASVTAYCQCQYSGGCGECPACNIL